jgi:hypothetical protein
MIWTDTSQEEVQMSSIYHLSIYQSSIHLSSICLSDMSIIYPPSIIYLPFICLPSIYHLSTIYHLPLYLPSIYQSIYLTIIYLSMHTYVCSISLAIREMKIKTILRFHLIPATMAIIKIQNVGEDVEKNWIFGGNVNFTAIMESSVEVPQKTEEKRTEGTVPLSHS